MAFRQIRVSDLTGAELTDETATTVYVRPANKQIDVLLDEMKALKTLTNLVQLEIKKPDGSTEFWFCTEAEFKKVVPDAVLEEADAIRGRRSGVSVLRRGKKDDDDEAEQAS